MRTRSRTAENANKKPFHVLMVGTSEEKTNDASPKKQYTKKGLSRLKKKKDESDESDSDSDSSSTFSSSSVSSTSTDSSAEVKKKSGVKKKEKKKVISVIDSSSETSETDSEEEGVQVTKPPTAKGPAKKPPTSKAPSKKSPTAKAPAKKPAKAATNKSTTKAATNKPPTSKAPATKPPTTNAPTTKPATSKAPSTANNATETTSSASVTITAQSSSTTTPPAATNDPAAAPAPQSKPKDYLEQRQQYTKSKTNGTSVEEEEDIWHGATPVEIAVVNSCDDHGSITPGKESYFAALIAHYCQSLSERALALAVLQRTLENDKSNDFNPVHTRIAKFLSAGGLTLLNTWFVDAYTPERKVSQIPNPAYEAPKRGRPKQTQQKKQSSEEEFIVKRTQSPSPTGPLLIPILEFLKDIPFDSALMKETRITKQINKLRKMLDFLLKDFDSSNDESSIGDRRLQSVVSPFSGGLPAVTVRVALLAVIDSWKQEEALHKDDESYRIPDEYAELKARIHKGHEALCTYEKTGQKPPWLEPEPTPPPKNSPPEPKPKKQKLDSRRRSIEQIREDKIRKKREAEIKKLAIQKRLRVREEEQRNAERLLSEGRKEMDVFPIKIRKGSMQKLAEVAAAAAEVQEMEEGMLLEKDEGDKGVEDLETGNDDGKNNAEDDDDDILM